MEKGLVKSNNFIDQKIANFSTLLYNYRASDGYIKIQLSRSGYYLCQKKKITKSYFYRMQNQFSIITIGDELLIGQVVDTNSAWMAKLLTNNGMKLTRRLAIGDSEIEILNAVEEEKKYADIILMTGGLGPTSDDLTKPSLCKYFGGKLVMNQEVLQHLTHLFEEVLKRPMTDRNREQAMLPDVCTIIPNSIGTAAGMLFEDGEKMIISMPGVPTEMKLMMEKEVIPLLKRRYNFSDTIHETIVCNGIAESNVADMLVDFEAGLSKNVSLAYLPNYGMLRLRLTGSSDNVEQLKVEMRHTKETLKKLLADFCIADEDLKMQEIVANMLIQNKETVSTAESCTGGYIAHLLTAISGSSTWYEGSGVSYSNQVKENLFGVKHQTLLDHGAVSEEVVIQMAEAALKIFNTTYSIAVSGIMGPGGGTAEKPVGTVWMAVAGKENVLTRKLRFRFDREKNIELTAMNALNLLRELIGRSVV